MAIEYREQHRREAIIGTVAIHALLAALFVFTVFKGPDPPLEALGGDGVELNYGVDEAGSGDIQSKAVANESQNREDSRPPASSPDPEPRPVQQAAEPVPQEASEDKIVTSEAEESPVTVPPVEKPAPKREEVKEVPKPKPVEKPRTLYTPKGSASGGGNGENGTSNAPTGNNNGDNPGTVGDKGDPRGTYNGTAYSGEPGSGGRGISPGSGGLDMAGWAAVNRPNVAGVDNNPGFVKYKIKINAEGEIEAVTKVSGNVSPAQDRLCRDALEKVEFRRTNAAEGGATGFYTFRFTVQ